MNDVGTAQPIISVLIRSALNSMLQVHIPHGCLGIRNWASINVAPAQERFSWLWVHWQNTPPLQHSPLAVLRWIPTAPLEWGITGRGPTINFVHDISTVSRNVESLAWRAESGTNDYANRARSALPFQQISYGPLAYNMLFQCMPVVQEIIVPLQRSTPAIRSQQMALAPPAPYPENTVQLQPDLQIIMPCTLPTYDWENDNIFIPTITGAEIPPGILGYLRNIRGQQNQVGFMWYPISPDEIVAEDHDDEDDAFFNQLGNLALAPGEVPAHAAQARNPPPPPVVPDEQPRRQANQQHIPPANNGHPPPGADVQNPAIPLQDAAANVQQ